MTSGPRPSVSPCLFKDNANKRKTHVSIQPGSSLSLIHREASVQSTLTRSPCFFVARMREVVEGHSRTKTRGECTTSQSFRSRSSGRSSGGSSREMPDLGLSSRG